MKSFWQHGPGRTKARGAPTGVMGLGDTGMMLNVNRHFFTTARNGGWTATISSLVFSCSKDLCNVSSMENPMRRLSWDSVNLWMPPSDFLLMTSWFSWQTDSIFHSFSSASCSTDTQYMAMTGRIRATVVHKPPSESHHEVLSLSHTSKLHVRLGQLYLSSLTK